MVSVSISETYDLATIQNRCTLIGIHTPRVSQIRKSWGGFFTNFRKFRLTGCDVQMACASMLPADPLQVGVEAGDIAPQDLFNPILYRAVSNDSFDMIVSRMWGIRGGSGATTPILGSSADVEDDEVFPTAVPLGDGTATDFDFYYGILQDRSGWRTAMPQAGLEMHDLVPLLHELLVLSGSNFQGNSSGSLGRNSPSMMPDTSTDTQWANVNVTGSIIKGKSSPWPWMPTVRYGTQVTNSLITGNYVGGTVNVSYNAPFDMNSTSNGSNEDISSPMCYVACILVPPAKLSRLYYRMVVKWNIEFAEPVSMTNWMSLSSLAQFGNDYYTNSYDTASARMEKTQSMVDIVNGEIEKVMDG